MTSSVGYDPAGNALSYTDGSGTVGYRSNAADDLVALWEPDGSCPATPTFPDATHCTGFGYDTSGRQNQISFPSGQVTPAGWDCPRSARPCRVPRRPGEPGTPAVPTGPR